MAKSHYNADSASFPSHSLHRGMPAAGDENPVKTADFPALAVDHASPSPAATSARSVMSDADCRSARSSQERT
jgi:hypothetical protein